jgi:hypothetical protein
MSMSRYAPAQLIIKMAILQILVLLLLTIFVHASELKPSLHHQ